MIMNICCLLIVGDSLKRRRFEPFPQAFAAVHQRFIQPLFNERG
jgi:hypothetical protein